MGMKNPVHPGRIVKSTIEELDLSVTEAAKALNVSRPTLFQSHQRKGRHIAGDGGKTIKIHGKHSCFLDAAADDFRSCQSRGAGRHHYRQPGCPATSSPGGQ